MAKKKTQIDVTAGGRFICPGCSLQFRTAEYFVQHLKHGCKPAKSDGPTWSEANTDETSDDTPES